MVGKHANFSVCCLLTELHKGVKSIQSQPSIHAICGQRVSSSFFSSGLADVARGSVLTLKLLLWPCTSSNPRKRKTTNKHNNPHKTTRKSPSQICVSSEHQPNPAPTTTTQTRRPANLPARSAFRQNTNQIQHQQRKEDPTTTTTTAVDKLHSQRELIKTRYEAVHKFTLTRTYVRKDQTNSTLSWLSW